MKIINENVYITWCEDTTWRVSEWFEGEWYDYYMDADEIEAEWGDVWQAQPPAWEAGAFFWGGNESAYK